MIAPGFEAKGLLRHGGLGQGFVNSLIGEGLVVDEQFLQIYESVHELTAR